MATITETYLIDDLSGERETDTVKVSTVEFGLDGKDYSIDLSDPNAEKLRDALAEFIAKATLVSGPKRGRRGPKASSGNGLDNKAIRAWAKEQGLKVSDRGRIPDSLTQAYLKRDAVTQEAPSTEAPAAVEAPVVSEHKPVVADPFTPPADEQEASAEPTPIRGSRRSKSTPKAS